MSPRDYLPTFTGKSVQKGGSRGRDIATAQGGVFVLNEALKSFKISSRGTVAIQGFGNAGQVMAKLLHQQGFKIVAVSDSKKALYCADGLDPDQVKEFKEQNGHVGCCVCQAGNKRECGCQGDGQCHDCRYISNSELLTLDVDILIPAALENQITKANVKNIKAKLVLELANGPTTPEADQVLRRRRIVVVPDILANSGGVTVSYFEWYQNKHGEKWTKEKVAKKLAVIMRRSFREILLLSKRYRTDLRTAAGILAVQRLAVAIKKQL